MATKEWMKGLAREVDGKLNITTEQQERHQKRSQDDIRYFERIQGLVAEGLGEINSELGREVLQMKPDPALAPLANQRSFKVHAVGRRERMNVEVADRNINAWRLTPDGYGDPDIPRLQLPLGDDSGGSRAKDLTSGEHLSDDEVVERVVTHAVRGLLAEAQVTPPRSGRSKRRR